MRMALVALFAVALSGCGTIVTLSDSKTWPNQIYAGTRASARGHATQPDIPFSLVADTLILPYTIPRTIYNIAHQPKPPGSAQHQPDGSSK